MNGGPAAWTNQWKSLVVLVACIERTLVIDGASTNLNSAQRVAGATSACCVVWHMASAADVPWDSQLPRHRVVDWTRSEIGFGPPHAQTTNSFWSAVVQIADLHLNFLFHWSGGVEEGAG